MSERADRTFGKARADAPDGFFEWEAAGLTWLAEAGGHIGYSVRASRRREGIASAALRLGLERAREIGLERVMITCDVDNEASRRAIEGAGGEYEDTREGKLRYWVPSG